MERGRQVRGEGVGKLIPHSAFGSRTDLPFSRSVVTSWRAGLLLKGELSTGRPPMPPCRAVLTAGVPSEHSVTSHGTRAVAYSSELVPRPRPTLCKH